METLYQFLMRLGCGLAVAMAITSPRLVTSGFFRNHSYVLLGIGTLAAVDAWRLESRVIWPAISVALAAYAAAIAWLYERKVVGRILLAAAAGFCTIGARLGEPGFQSGISPPAAMLWWSDFATSSLLLGFTIASMLLGHWYLNAPGMKTAPLFRLLIAMTVALAARVLLNGYGLVMWVEQVEDPLSGSEPALLALRWLFGIVGLAILIVMAWKTLKIPNTQSATGILYVAVIAVFTGELMSLLLSGRYPAAL